MSKILGRVDPGVKDGSKKRNLVVTVQRKFPPGNPQNYAYNNQLVGFQQRSVLVQSNRRPLKALPYRIFSGSYELGAFDEEYKLSKSVYRRWGTTPVASSVGASVSLYWGTKLSGGVYVPDVSQNLQNRAITECLNKLQDQKVDVLTNLAEARESIDLVAKLVSRIVRSLLLFRKGKFAQAYRVLTGFNPGKKDLRGSQAWLSYKYGIIPLLGDIQGAWQLAHQGLKDTPIIRAKRLVSADYGFPSKPTHYKTWQVGGSCKVGAEVMLAAKLSDPYINLLGQMGLYNPFAVAWELVPFSFVVDWILPIGNALQALTATLGIEFHDGYLNTKTVTDISWSGSNVAGSSGTLPNARLRNVCQWRQVYLDFPSPRLYMKSPFSTSHVVSALALFAVLRK